MRVSRVRCACVGARAWLRRMVGVEDSTITWASLRMLLQRRSPHLLSEVRCYGGALAKLEVRPWDGVSFTTFPLIQVHVTALTFTDSAVCYVRQVRSGVEAVRGLHSVGLRMQALQ